MDYDEIQSWLQQVSDDVDYAVGKVTTLEDTTESTAKDIADLTADVYALQEQVALMAKELADLSDVVGQLHKSTRALEERTAGLIVYGSRKGGYGNGFQS